MTRIAVVGAGLMGSQIAVQAALHGLEVSLQDISAEQLRRSETANRAHLQRRVERGRMSADDVEQAFSRIQQSTDLEAAVAGAELVIEAAFENLDVKRELFTKLDQLAPAEAVLASNSSTIVISRLAGATRRPDRCANMHFFSPVLVMDLCEVVMGPETSDATAQRCCDVVREMGRTPVLIRKEVEGFVVNRIYLAASQEAHRLYEQGVAGIPDIDTAVEKGLNWPMGPFRLNDFTGLDVTYGARKHIYEATGDERYKPTRALEERVQRGDLGRKTGRGWYSYEEEPA